MSTIETIEEVYRELNFPSKRKLALALHTRRIPFTGEQLEELTRTSAVRQIFGPPPKYEGKVASAHINERWQASATKKKTTARCLTLPLIMVHQRFPKMIRIISKSHGFVFRDMAITPIAVSVVRENDPKKYNIY